MTQTFLNMDMITLKSLGVLSNNTVLARTVNRQYDSSFAQAGAKIGDTLRIRLPNRYKVSSGPNLQPQDYIDQATTIAITEQDHIDLNFTSAEMALSLDEFTDRIINPAMQELASTIDAKIALNYKKIYNLVGTPGTTPATSLVLLDAMRKMNDVGVPMSQRYAAVNPAANAGLVEGLKGLFNPTNTISNQFKSGMMGEGILGFSEFNMSQCLATHTNGNWGTTITSTGNVTTEGSTSLPISFSGSSKTWLIGDVFTVAGVYAVNPKTRSSTGALQQFTAAADLTASSTGTLTVSPAMYSASHVLATVGRLPLATDVVTMVGTAATAYPQNLVYHKDAIVFATADLPMLPGGISSRKQANGVSVRLADVYSATDDRIIKRFDVLYGSNACRPDLAVRMIG